MTKNAPVGPRDGSRAEDLPAPTIRQETCTTAAVRRVAALLDLNPTDISDGQQLPQGWHFFLLAGDTRRSSLREDGFPGPGIELPELGLPRLLIVGRDVDYLAPIRVGQTLARASSRASLERRDTGKGPMAVVKIRHSLGAIENDTPLLIEQHTYYLLGPAAARLRADENGPGVSGEHIRRVTPDDTMLFQYSALSFNSHKIHLDRDYAQRVEGHQDLVVNGGLIVLQMTELLRTTLGVELRSVRVRHMAPLYSGGSVTIVANRSPDSFYVCAYDHRGVIATEMKAVTA